jgi:hypothetical protein
MGKEKKFNIKTPEMFSPETTNNYAIHLISQGFAIEHAFLAKDIIMAGHSVGFNTVTGKVVKMEPIDHTEDSR